MNNQETEKWWQKNSVFMLSAGHTKAKRGAEFWFDNFWKPFEPSAWAYELVRAVAIRKVEWRPAEKELVATLCQRSHKTNHVGSEQNRPV